MVYYSLKESDVMYDKLGSTDIIMYDLLNVFANIAVFVFNFLMFRQKKNLLSNRSLFFIKITSKKAPQSLLAKAAFWTVMEIALISAMQHMPIGILNGTFGGIMKTGANYFGFAFFIPVILLLFYYLIAVNPFKQMDLFVPAEALALVFIKLGCFCSGCCHGFECSWGLNNYSYKDGPKREFPVQLLEAGLALAIFFFLLWYRKRAKEGTVFPMFLILYSATRFFSEFTRGEENILGPLKLYHLLCIAGVIVGVAEFFVVTKFAHKITPYFERTVFPRYKEKKKNIVHHRNKKNKRPAVTTISTPDYSKYKKWAIIWLLGLAGQIGWNLEGTWLNTFVYEKIDKNPSVITAMLIMSALATTVSVFLFGTITDRTGNRRHLISSGFIIWGILNAGFALTQFISERSLGGSVVCIIIIDMLLSFFATMSTESGYSTWLTDIMNDRNRGQIGAAFAIQSVLASLIVNVLGGFLIGKDNNYIRLFILSGTFLSVLGIVSLFLFTKKDDAVPSVRGTFGKQFISVFDFKALIKHKELLCAYAAVTVFFIGYNTYFSYLGNYIIHYLGFSANQMGIMQAVPLLLAMLVTMPATKYINNRKFVNVSVVSLVMGLIGLSLILSIDKELIDTTKYLDWKLFFSVFCVGASYITMIQTLKTWTKFLYPKESSGQFEGLWVLSFGFIPMLFASNIGEIVVKGSGETILNELSGRYEYIPNENVFLVGILISTLSIIPILLAKKYEKKRQSLPGTDSVYS